MCSRRASGVAVAFLLFHTALVASCTCLLPMVLLLLAPTRWGRRAYRFCAQLLQEAWFALACLLLSRGLGVRIFVHVAVDGLGGLAGLEQRCSGRDVVLIANHRTRIDWMFIWGLCLAIHRLGSLKIVLKDSLRQAPGFGWAMQAFGFVFLSRSNRAADLAALRSAVEYHCKEPGAGLTLLLFPEGTDLSASNLEKSRAYAKANGLQLYDEVLHPKTAGFVAAMEAAGASAVLLDVTVAYVESKPGERPSEQALFTGHPPVEVHLRVDVAPTVRSADPAGGVQQVAEGSCPQHLAKVCSEAFRLKEARLTRFTAPVKGGEGGTRRPDVAALAEGCQVVELPSAPGAWRRMLVGTLAFGLLEALCLWGAIRFWRLAIGVFLTAIFAFGLGSRCGGLDGLERWHARRWPAPARAR